MLPNLTLDITPAPEEEFISQTGTLRDGSLLINREGLKNPVSQSNSNEQNYLIPESAEFVVRHNELHVLGKLGEGGQGCVMKMHHMPTNQPVAVKEFRIDLTSEQMLAQVKKEIRTLYSLKHSGIVPCFGAWFMDGKVFFALKYCSRGSLGDLKKIIPESIIKGIAYQLLDSFVYLKQCHVIHRDLKPHNILVDEQGKVLLTDFGVAAAVESSMPMNMSWVGTASYMSPERLASQKYNWQTDMWSLGLTLLELITKVIPFSNHPTLFDLLDAIETQPAPIPRDGSLSNEMVDILEKLLEKNPSDRPDPEILLEHPWFEDADVFKSQQWLLFNTQN
ncbi:hypothetical protein PCE1_000985 [Barthelona sp. PCE]